MPVQKKSGNILNAPRMLNIYDLKHFADNILNESEVIFSHTVK